MPATIDADTLSADDELAGALDELGLTWEELSIAAHSDDCESLPDPTAARVVWFAYCATGPALAAAR